MVKDIESVEFKSLTDLKGKVANSYSYMELKMVFNVFRIIKYISL